MIIHFILEITSSLSRVQGTIKLFAEQVQQFRSNTPLGSRPLAMPPTGFPRPQHSKVQHSVNGGFFGLVRPSAYPKVHPQVMLVISPTTALLFVHMYL